MEKIVFHSYKGGSGRTLALANMAFALRATGNRVLLIDLDFDAPGLAYKLNVSSKVSGGYIAYLNATSPEARAAGVNGHNWDGRQERLKKYMIEVETPGAPTEGSGPPLRLLTSGDPESEEYWIQLGSDSVQELFAFGLAKFGGPPLGDLSAHVSWRAFMRDIEDIEIAAGYPDYCLIDCRSIRDTVSPALSGWADHVFEFFHCNLEGVLGLHLLQDRLYARQAGAGEGRPKFTPVVTRIPNYLQPGTIRGMIDSLSLVLRSRPSNRFAELQLQDLQVLPEQQAVEFGDLLVLREPECSIHSLAHDYVDLFVRITGYGEQTARDVLRESLNLDESLEIADRTFAYNRALGHLFNRDGVANVALRKVTLTILVNDILAGLSEGSKAWVGDAKAREKKIEDVFLRAGLAVGRSFGEETSLNPNMWRDGVRPADVATRLEQWCEFDGQAGLGVWSADWDGAKGEARLNLGNHFLDAVTDKLGDPFMHGYLQGVLEYVLAETGTVKVAFVPDKGTGSRREFRFRRKG